MFIKESKFKSQDMMILILDETYCHMITKFQGYGSTIKCIKNFDLFYTYYFFPP